jgi:hypothetical protein
MHVCIEPPSSIQNSNDIAYTWHGSLYTWHGSTDLYQIGKTIVICAKRFCLIQKGCNSAQTVNAEIASNKSRIDSMSYRLLRKGGIPIAPRDSINDQGNTTLLKRFLVRMKYLAWRNDKLWHLLKHIDWSYKLWLVMPKSTKGSWSATRITSRTIVGLGSRTGS